MRVYVYQAALLCEACGVAVKEAKQIDCECCGGTHADLPAVDCRAFYPSRASGDNRPLHPDHGTADPEEHWYDSGDYPKGPYDSRDSESDSPDHCDHCHVFLETRLTPDGAAYVLDAVAEFDYLKRGKADVIALWREFYKDDINDASERRACSEHADKRRADIVDGYNRDDTGESHD